MKTFIITIIIAIVVAVAVIKTAVAFFKDVNSSQEDFQGKPMK